ncbi:IPT/TIG domain-containing protein [bacterium]|nr:IPT/TIG domain-containing protein [bacterium]
MTNRPLTLKITKGICFLTLLITSLIMALPYKGISAPRITGVLPNQGPKAGANITITGEGFSPDDKITIWGGGTYIKGSYPTTGPANALSCSGSYAYLACGSEGETNVNGVQIFDIQDRANPRPVSFFELTQKANDILVFGNYAYVADTDGGLQILDVHDPNSPSLITSLLLPDYMNALKISVYGSHIYMAADYGGLLVIDISDPAAPCITGSCAFPPDGYALDVIAEGDYAYVAAGWEGVKVINITNPANPKLIATFSSGRFISGIYKYQNYLYLSAMKNGIEIVDVSVPGNPLSVTNFSTPGLARETCVMGNNLYVANDYCGVEVFNNDIQNFSMVGFQETLGRAVDLQIFDNHIFVAGSQGGFQIIDVANSRNPSIVNIADLMDGATGVQVSGLYLQKTLLSRYIYIFSKSYSFGQNWLKIIDVSDPKNIKLLGSTYDIGPRPEDLEVSQGYAYLVDGDDGLQVFNVTDKRNPQMLPFYDNDTSGGRGIFSRDNKLFLADSKANGMASLKIFGLSLSMFPYLAGESPLNTLYASAEAICGMGEGYAIVAAGTEGIEIFNVQTPSQPFRLKNLSIPGYINDVISSGQLAYLLNKNGLVQILDTGTPSNPVILGSCETIGEARSLSLINNHLYLAEWGTGVHVIDVVDPATPLAIASLKTLTPPEDVIATDDYIYVAIESGMMILDTIKPCPSVFYVNDTMLNVDTPPGLSSGTYHITLTDPNGLIYLFPNGFTVGENHCPVITSIKDNDNIIGYAGEELSIVIDANDADNDPLTYSVSLYKLPAGATLNGNVFSWTPEIKYTGGFRIYEDIVFTVSDVECIDEKKIDIWIIEEISNVPPVIDVPATYYAKEGTAMAFLIDAYDYDPGDLNSLDFTVQNAPQGSSFRILSVQADKVTCGFFWTPTYTQSGAYDITFVVKDRHLAQGQATASVIVQNITGPILSINFINGRNIWICPAGRTNYTSFDLLRELGEDAVYSILAYDWDSTVVHSCSWFYGRPSGDDFPMNQSRVYAVFTKADVSLSWPIN